MGLSGSGERVGVSAPEAAAVGIGTTAPNVKLSLGTDVTAQKLALYDGASDFYGFGVQGGRMVFHTLLGHLSRAFCALPFVSDGGAC